MNILLSNDDGIAANGLRALSEELSKNHKVYIVAPDRERSAAGHSLTLHTPLRVEELDNGEYGSTRAWVTTGTPGDCVKIAINAILGKDEKPDLVISGINHGPNLGADILYSGTVSCAMEGAMMGYPSIAVSLATMQADYEDFKYPAQYISSLIDKLKDFAVKIAQTFREHKSEVDETIKKYAIGWDFDRLVKMDKDILRIAISELLYIKEAPMKVVVDEALELAKKYSTDDSASFVNGILAKVIVDNGIK